MRLYLIVLLLSFSLAPMAQEKKDSIPEGATSKEVEVTISLNALNLLKNEKDKALNDLDLLQIKFKEIQKGDSVRKSRLSKLEADSVVLSDNFQKLLESQERADKCLINMASNFLYIPYEAYSVEQIAIPAFEAVMNQSLKEQHRIKYTLLKSYQNDIKEIIAFLDSVEQELNHPFVKEANALVEKLRIASFYEHYSPYEDWQDTYLGRKITNIDNQLKAFDGKIHRIDFTDIKGDLESCLKTIEDL